MDIAPISMTTIGAGTAARRSDGNAGEAAARAFSAMVAGEMVARIIPDGGALAGDGIGAGIWRDMLAEAIGRQLAESGAFALARPGTAATGGGVRA